MTIISAVTSELIASPGSVVVASNSSFGMLTTRALSATRFLACFSGVDSGSAPQGFQRYILLDETGAELQATQFPYINQGGTEFFSDPHIVQIDATHVIEAAIGTTAAGGTAKQLRVRGVHITDTGITQTFLNTHPSLDNISTEYSTPSGTVCGYDATTGMVIFAVMETTGFHVTAVNPADGSVYWTHVETDGYPQNGGLGLYLHNGFVTIYTFRSDNNIKVYEYSTTTSGPTTTISGTVIGTHNSSVYSPVNVFLNPYLGLGYGILFMDDVSSVPMVWSVLTGTGLTNTVSSTPDNLIVDVVSPPKDGYPDAQFIYCAFQPYEDTTNYYEANGIRILAYNPVTAVLEISSEFRTSVLGLQGYGDYGATWYEWDTISRGRATVHFDPVSNMGIAGVITTTQHTNPGSSEYHTVHLWVVNAALTPPPVFPSPPISVTATYASPTNTLVSWSSSGDDITSYIVDGYSDGFVDYFDDRPDLHVTGTLSGGPFLAGTPLQLVVGGVVDGLVYCWTVRAVNGAGTSDFSAPVCILQAPPVTPDPLPDPLPPISHRRFRHFPNVYAPDGTILDVITWPKQPGVIRP